MTVIRVPETFVADFAACEGEAARLSLARLPELIGELCARWGLRVTGDPMHGYLALVAPAFPGVSGRFLSASWTQGPK